MSQSERIRKSNLAYVLQIGKEQSRIKACDLPGHFDEEKNYVDDTGSSWPYKILLRPWEWVVIPEFVELAKQQGVEIPEDPPIDLSKTY